MFVIQCDPSRGIYKGHKDRKDRDAVTFRLVKLFADIAAIKPLWRQPCLFSDFTQGGLPCGFTFFQTSRNLTPRADQTVGPLHQQYLCLGVGLAQNKGRNGKAAYRNFGHLF
nr:hypothetical protein [uncultured Sulfitobacter sp.]